MKTQNKVNYEIKRMLNLFESKLGNVKTIINEESNMFELEEQEEKEFDYLKNLEKNLLDILQKDKGANAKMNSEWSSLSDENFQKIQKTATEKGKANPFKVGDRYVLVRFGTPEKQFMVFGKKGLKPNTLAGVLMSDPGNTRSYTDYMPIEISLPSMFERSKSLVSQRENLNAEQQARVDQFIKSPGVAETGYSLTAKRPNGSEGVDYVAVDLATGIGKVNGKDVQIIKKLATDNLDPEFQTPNKYYVWARIGTKTQLTDIPVFIEKKLTEWGYTKNQQEIANSPDAEVLFGMVTTLEDFCSTTTCPPEFTEYMKTNPNAKIWPKTNDAAQKAGGSVQRGVKGSLRRQTRELGGGQRECKRQVDVYEKCLGFYTNNKSTFGANCITSIKNLGGNFASIPSLANGLSMIKNNIKDCANNLKGDYSASIQKFFGLPDGHPLKLSSGSEPEEDKTKAMMESTISDSIRTVINEHFKKENKDNLNTIIKKNLRRFL